MNLCPHCHNEAGGIKVSDDDFLDYCHECDVLIEGQTITEKECEDRHE